MALTNAQIAQQVAMTLRDSRGHTQGRNNVKRVTHTVGQTSMTVVLRSGETRTLTVTGS